MVRDGPYAPAVRVASVTRPSVNCVSGKTPGSSIISTVETSASAATPAATDEGRRGQRLYTLTRTLVAGARRKRSGNAQASQAPSRHAQATSQRCTRRTLPRLPRAHQRHEVQLVLRRQELLLQLAKAKCDFRLRVGDTRFQDAESVRARGLHGSAVHRCRGKRGRLGHELGVEACTSHARRRNRVSGAAGGDWTAAGVQRERENSQATRARPP